MIVPLERHLEERTTHFTLVSTINRSSNQTVESKTSKGILKTYLGDRKYKKRINSGYFEFVSPTRIQSSSNSYVTPRSSKAKNNPVGFDMLKRPIHYGYFEVKERNYESHSAHQEGDTP
ncbi:hypothetical protein QE152_g27189 [Popillia japonica]|uniref:Uncharacterized protein n=1 Tax=Popillia japonica TaxID=7064 RepID=A0AAW1JU66_POPJA